MFVSLATPWRSNFSATRIPSDKRFASRISPSAFSGVLQTKGQSSNGQDQDDMMLMPYTTVQKKISGISWVQMIMVSTASQEAMTPVQAAISALLRQRHHLRTAEDDDFIIRSPNEIAQAASATSYVLTLLLASIASVSLLVGGIGIMNIMLVSVTERTRRSASEWRWEPRNRMCKCNSSARRWF